MDSIKRFQFSSKKTVKTRMVKLNPSDPRQKMDCVATGGSIVSTALF